MADQTKVVDSVIPNNLKAETRSMGQSSAVVMSVIIYRDDVSKSFIIDVL